MIADCTCTGHRDAETQRIVQTVRRALAIMPLAIVVGISLAAAQTCGSQKLAVQILGSGSPFPSSSASSGYIVWVDGRSAVLVDAAGGVFHRFGESGARIDELEFVAISHLHPDHVSDLPALLWLTGTRSAPLRIAGPSGNGQFPPFATFLRRLMGGSGSAFPVLSRRSNGNQGGSATLESLTVDVAKQEPTSLTRGGRLQVTALGVPHTAPSVAYRVSVDGVGIVFGSDQNGSNPQFVTFARDADVLVMHFAISTNAQGAITQNHATPGVIGDVAARAKARRLILSHVTRPLADDPNGAVYSAYDQATLTMRC